LGNALQVAKAIERLNLSAKRLLMSRKKGIREPKEKEGKTDFLPLGSERSKHESVKKKNATSRLGKVWPASLMSSLEIVKMG